MEKFDFSLNNNFSAEEEKYNQVPQHKDDNKLEEEFNCSPGESLIDENPSSGDPNQLSNDDTGGSSFSQEESLVAKDENRGVTRHADNKLGEIANSSLDLSSEEKDRNGAVIKNDIPNLTNQVLIKVLNLIKPVDLNELVKQRYAESKQVIDEKKIGKKHHIVEAIDEIIRAANSVDSGLRFYNEKFYCYEGSYWCTIYENELRLFLGLCAERLGIDIYDAKYCKFKGELLQQFKDIAEIPMPTPDEKSTIINLSNGTYEVKDGKGYLRSFKRDDFLTYKLPFKYVPNDDAPGFQSYLDKVLPYECAQLVLAEYVASIFIRSLKLEKAMILFGEGSSGKSVYFEIISSLLGDENVANYSLNKLTDSTGYHRAKLENKLLNYASEISGNLESSVFKQLVSGEPVEVRLPYKEPYIIKSYAKLIFNCNELPYDIEFTNAFFRRFLIVPFNVTIPETEQDKDLANKIIKSELSGVFNWVLSGLSRLIKNQGFSPCDEIEAEVNKYKTEADNVVYFIQENNYEHSLEEYMAQSDLYKEYRQYCMENGFKPCNLKNFKKRLKRLHYHFDRKTIGNVVYISQKSSPKLSFST